MPKIFGSHSLCDPGCPISPKAPFRESIRVFVQECAEREDYTVRGMQIWCTLLVHDNRSMVVPLYTIEEDVKTSEEPFCDQCRPTVGTIIGEHGTATILLVLDNVIVIAADSRISSITNWIVKPHWFKVRKIRENPASVAYYNKNIADAENMLDHLEDKEKKTSSQKSLIRATSKFMNNEPWESFGGHLASIDSKPMAHLVVQEAEPQHVAGCRWEANWDKCNCWDIDSKRQILCKEDSRNIMFGQWRKCCMLLFTFVSMQYNHVNEGKLSTCTWKLHNSMQHFLHCPDSIVLESSLHSICL